jgi:hypothetical protein
VSADGPASAPPLGAAAVAPPAGATATQLGSSVAFRSPCSRRKHPTRPNSVFSSALSSQKCMTCYVARLAKKRSEASWSVHGVFFVHATTAYTCVKPPLVLRTVYTRPRKILKPPKALVARLLQYVL